MKTTHLIIGLNVLIFLVMLKVGGIAGMKEFSDRTVLEFGANYGPLVVHGGQWWRLCTSMFVHANALHLLMNMVALYQVGVVLEPHYGRLRYVLLYLAAGLAGSAASLVWHWNHPVPSVGASGAGCGLVAAGAVAGHLLLGIAPHARKYRDSMVQWLLMIVVFGFIGHIDAAAHTGGMAAGAGIAWLMDRRIGALKRGPQKDTGVGVEAFLLLLIVGVCFGLAARARGDSYSAGELINQGVELAKAGKNEEAMALYGKALVLDPNDEIGHYDLALGLARAGRLTECAEHAREAARLDPSKKDYQQLADDCGDLRPRLKLIEPDGGSDDE